VSKAELKGSYVQAPLSMPIDGYHTPMDTGTNSVITIVFTRHVDHMINDIGFTIKNSASSLPGQGSMSLKHDNHSCRT
jgi:hypothetical protein